MAVEKPIVEELNKLSVLELVELKNTLEEQWGVTAAAAAPVMVQAAAGGGGDAAAAEEQTAFDVVLTSTGDKIQVIKVIRELTGLGLKEAKAVADEAPAPVKESVAKEEAAADEGQAREEAGAGVELK